MLKPLRLVPAVLLSVPLVALAGCGSARTFDVAGTLTLNWTTHQAATGSDEIVPPGSDCGSPSGLDDSACVNHYAGAACAGGSGYEDLVSGAQVSITDGSGKVVALGTLSSGTEAQAANFVLHCVFKIHVASVPDSGGIYGIKAAGHDLGNFSKSDASALALNVGN